MGNKLEQNENDLKNLELLINKVDPQNEIYKESLKEIKSFLAKTAQDEQDKEEENNPKKK